eukprot:s621_g8.t1
MPSETRADLIAKMVEMGEVPPAHWTVMQIKARLSELRTTMLEDQPVTLKQRMAELNEAAKKKATLVARAESKQIPMTGNMTIAQIYALAEQQLTQEVVPSPLEKMSFGTHRDKTYLEVWTQHKSYVKWAIQTMEESDDVNWRLRRFASWAMNFKGPAQMPPVNVKPQLGYRASGSQSHVLRSPGNSSDASFSVVEGDQQAEIEMLRQELEATKKEKMELELAAGRIKSRRET